MQFTLEEYLFSSYHIGTAIRIRGDHRTENGTFAALQNIFRADGTDNFAGERSFQYGKSIASQVFFLVSSNFAMVITYFTKDYK